MQVHLLEASHVLVHLPLHASNIRFILQLVLLVKLLLLLLRLLRLNHRVILLLILLLRIILVELILELTILILGFESGPDLRNRRYGFVHGKGGLVAHLVVEVLTHILAKLSLRHQGAKD